MRVTTAILLQMAPKQDIIYSRGKSKSVVVSCQMVANFDNRKDPEYVLSGATNPTPITRVTRGTP